MSEPTPTCQECGAPFRERASVDGASIPLRDPATGAINRALLLEAAAPMLSLARRNARTMAFLHIHVGGLARRVVEHAGEESALIGGVTRRILDAVRDSDFVARVEADRFVVALTEVWEADAAVRVAQRLVQSLTASLGDDPPAIVRVGVSFFPFDADGLDELLYQARAAVPSDPGRAGIGFADPVIGVEALRRAGLERDLAGSDAVSQFRLHYQPIFSMDSGEVVGVESLIRWDHSLQGLLPAADFITLAERTGRVRAMDQWALEQALIDTLPWRDQGWTGWVSVNFSGRTLSDPRLVEQVETLLERTGADPGTVVFEVTESAAVSGDGQATRVLDGLRSLGSRVAVDDFGTGYASFSYLREFDPDLVKLDRLFVTGDDHPRSQRLLHSLVLMAHHMGKPVVVEGLEEEEQRQRLVDSGCDMVQGYLLGRPVAPEEFTRRYLPTYA
jgi:EAL domain-containing protein (putative c-di-GMP-specific phosphodiesterase class I)/GGDEF domain-containing protein